MSCRRVRTAGFNVFSAADEADVARAQARMDAAALAAGRPVPPRLLLRSYQGARECKLFGGMAAADGAQGPQISAMVWAAAKVGAGWPGLLPGLPGRACCCARW